MVPTPALINDLHQLSEEVEKPPFDSVRAAFVEGDALYPGAGFFGPSPQFAVADNRA